MCIRDSVPSEPDKVEVSINAKRLAAFADGNDGVTVEYVADDAVPVSYTHLDVYKRQGGRLG